MENYQYIFVLVVGALFLLNLALKRRLLCPSSLLLGYSLLSAFSSYLMYDRPRTGDPYSSYEAVLYLSVAYSLFLIPLLFYRDSCDEVSDEKDIRTEIPYEVLVMVAAITVPAALYFSLDGFSNLATFATSGVDRLTFRASLNVGRSSTFISILFNLLSAFSYCALFLAVYSLLFLNCWKTTIALFVGGASAAISMLVNVARSGLIEMGMFCLSCGFVLWRFVPKERSRRAARLVALVLLLLSLPFMVLTMTRFNNATSEESPLSSILTYFATGPYSFNSDYEARVNMGVESLHGCQSMCFMQMLRDKIDGSSLYKDSCDRYEEMYLVGFPEYRELNNGYSGEFKTIVGVLLYDWEPGTVLTLFVLLCLFMSGLFLFGKGGGLWRQAVAAVYFYLVLYGPIGYGFGMRFRNTMLVFTLVGVMLLRRYESLMAVGGESK